MENLTAEEWIFIIFAIGAVIAIACKVLFGKSDDDVNYI